MTLPTPPVTINLLLNFLHCLLSSDSFSLFLFFSLLSDTHTHTHTHTQQCCWLLLCSQLHIIWFPACIPPLFFFDRYCIPLVPSSSSSFQSASLSTNRFRLILSVIIIPLSLILSLSLSYFLSLSLLVLLSFPLSNFVPLLYYLYYSLSLT